MRSPATLRSPIRPRWLTLAGPIGAALLALGALVPNVAAAPPTRAYAVASESAAATREAGRVLAAGGNAIDAAVCAALVAGFADPVSSGLGGGGFALVWSARDRQPLVLDFRESAPAAIDADLLEHRPVADDKRGQLVGVPGEVAGLFELHQRFGKTSWPDIVARAVRLAETGFAAEPHMTSQIDEQKAGPLGRSATFRSVYLPGGHAPLVGQMLRAPKLAKTLRRIASEGKRGLYEGPVASDIVSAVKSVGGGLALGDLTSYAPVVRQPLRVTWAGKEVLTMPPPSAGGLLLVETLSLFTPAELQASSAAPAKRLHLLAEAMRGAFADRVRYIADPAFMAANVAALLSPARMKQRKAHLAEERTHSLPRFGLEDAGTHHLVTADGDGNWVSLTTTINDAFGTKLVAEKSGIILNNQLADFATGESVAIFGMKESPNRPRPGARPVSSMSPTLVLERGEPILALGGSGALTIAPNVTQVLLSRLTTNASAVEAVSAPRFTIPAPRTGQTLWLESQLAKLYGQELESRGELLLTKESKNAVQLVAREAGKFVAAADPRKQGSALAENPAQ